MTSAGHEVRFAARGPDRRPNTGGRPRGRVARRGRRCNSVASAACVRVNRRRAGPPTPTREVNVAKSGKKTTTKKPPAKAAKAAKAVTPAKRAKAAAPAKKAAKKPVPPKATKKSTSAEKPAVKKAKAPAAEAKATKPKRPAARRRAADPRVEVKMPTGGNTAGAGSAGSGLSFLLGKPGSDNAADVAAEDRPRLSKTKLGVRDLGRYRDLLLVKRRELLRDVEGMEAEALGSEGTNLSHLPVHMADVGTDNYEQEFTLTLVDRERKLVEEIDHALVKIDAKTFGICEGTGQMISKERLDAQPWTRHSIEYARRRQRPGGRRA